jgi:DNA-directed RNA polymerase subunit K
MVNSPPGVLATLSVGDVAPALRVSAVSNEASETGRVYTRFERARILGARALQVSLGAPILVEVPDELIDPVTIAEKEFEAGVVPITVRWGPRDE